MTLLYGELAELWPLMSAPADYADGSVRAAQDRHVTGLFSHSAWVETLASVGFAVESAGDDPWRRPVFVTRSA